MKRFEARKAVLQALKDRGQFKESKDNPVVVPVCRCVTISPHYEHINTVYSMCVPFFSFTCISGRNVVTSVWERVSEKVMVLNSIECECVSPPQSF